MIMKEYFLFAIILLTASFAMAQNQGHFY